MQRKGEDRLGAKPALYVAMLIAVSLAAWVGKHGTDSIFACQAGLYATNRYLAYCDAPTYGDYDHGAVWFDLEPAVREHAAAADVLFLGDSRMQFAFSTRATADWFSLAQGRYYLWGFAYGENAVFAHALLEKTRPRARVYVINIDPFFERSETEPARIVLHRSDSESRYRQKQLWQSAHEAICSQFAAICRNHYAVFRARDDGAWSFSGAGRYESSPVSYTETVNRDAVEQYKVVGEDFLARLPATRDCIIFTIAPTAAKGSGTKGRTAGAIAAALQVTLIAPELDGLATFDGTHLDPPSAERWSAAFFREASPKILRCLGEPFDARSGGANGAVLR